MKNSTRECSPPTVPNLPVFTPFIQPAFCVQIVRRIPAAGKRRLPAQSQDTVHSYLFCSVCHFAQ